jgi:hypothetical protein
MEGIQRWNPDLSLERNKSDLRETDVPHVASTRRFVQVEEQMQDSVDGFYTKLLMNLMCSGACYGQTRQHLQVEKKVHTLDSFCFLETSMLKSGRY